jgi:hypothetical protein
MYIVAMLVLRMWASNAQIRYPVADTWDYNVLTAQRHTFGDFNVPNGWQVDNGNITFTGNVTDAGISAGETVSQLLDQMSGRIAGVGTQVFVQSGCLESASLTSHHRIARIPGGIYGLKVLAYTITGTPTTATDFVDTFNIAGPWKSGTWSWDVNMKGAKEVWGAASALTMSVTFTMHVSPQDATPVTLVATKHGTVPELTMRGATIGLFTTLSNIGSYSIDGTTVSSTELAQVKADNLAQQGLARDGSVETTYIVFNFRKARQLNVKNSTAQTVYATSISTGRPKVDMQEFAELREVDTGYNPL